MVRQIKELRVSSNNNWFTDKHGGSVTVLEE
jgi:hypothetical protein